MIRNKEISGAMTVHLGEVFSRLPKMPKFTEGIRRAPKRKFMLTRKETQLALRNALRYILPPDMDHVVRGGAIYISTRKHLYSIRRMDLRVYDLRGLLPEPETTALVSMVRELTGRENWRSRGALRWRLRTGE